MLTSAVNLGAYLKKEKPHHEQSSNEIQASNSPKSIPPAAECDDPNTQGLSFSILSTPKGEYGRPYC